MSRMSSRMSPDVEVSLKFHRPKLNSHCWSESKSVSNKFQFRRSIILDYCIF